MPALVAGIHALHEEMKAWRAGTSPAMTRDINHSLTIYVLS